jgi:hypothetical protein
MIPQSLKHSAEMLFMLFLALRIDQDVINEDHDKLVHLCHEYRVHHIHEVCGDIGQPERHHQLLIKTISGGESSLGDIFFMDLDLMITRSKINLRKYLCSYHLIKQEINTGQWILVLHSHRIEWSVIDTHTQCLVLLLH